MRIAVAAATGNTGSGVVRALAETGRHHVLAITRDPQGKVAQELAALPGVEAVTVEDAFNKPVDRLYFTSSVTRDQFLIETDLVIAARKAGVKYIVKLGTVAAWMEVYSEVFYGRAHLAVELFLERGDIPFTCLRANLFHNSIGGLDLASARKTHKFRSSLDGASVASIDPVDVGRAAAALLDQDDPSPHYDKKYLLSGPEDVNDQTIAAAIGDALKADVQFDGALTNDELCELFRAAGFQLDPKALLPSFNFFRQGKGDLAHMSTSPEMLALCPPTTTFKQFVARFYGEQH